MNAGGTTGNFAECRNFFREKRKRMSLRKRCPAVYRAFWNKGEQTADEMESLFSTESEREQERSGVPRGMYSAQRFIHGKGNCLYEF